MIDGVETRDLTVNADNRGHLVEMFRSDWELFDPDPEMAYYSLSYPGVIRAWHRHTEGQVDHFVCPEGRIRVGVYDDREESPTRGETAEFVTGEHDPQVIRVPGDCWHGFEAIGTEPALFVNFPTALYDYEDPDEHRLPPDTSEVPFDWQGDPAKS